MLQIKTTPALLGINTTRPIQQIQQPSGEQHIEQAKTQIKIDSEQSKITIDQYQCFAEAGLKNSLDLLKEVGQWSHQKVMEGILRRNQEGEMLSHFENGSNAVAEIARNNSFSTFDFNIEFIPKSRPQIGVQEGYLNIDWDLQKAKIDYQPHKPIHDYTPGKVELYMKQYQNIEMNFLDEKI